MEKQKKNIFTWFKWIEHLGTTSRRCLAIKSNNWLTRNDGGSAGTPPRDIVILSRHIGHLKLPVSRVCDAAISVNNEDKQCVNMAII